MLGLCVALTFAVMAGVAFERRIGSTWRQTGKTVAVFCAIAAGVYGLAMGLLALITHLARSTG